MKLSEIKTATDSQLLKAQADAMNSQGYGVHFSKMLENRINKIQIEIDKRKFNEYLNQDSHYFSEGHLEAWFKTQYHGQTKSEVRYNLERKHDDSGEVENCENEIGRKLTAVEETKLIKRFHSSVLKHIYFKRGIALGYIDSMGVINS